MAILQKILPLLIIHFSSTANFNLFVVRTDKADVNHLYLKFDHYNQSVIVPFYIENFVLVFHTINTIEFLFNVSKRLPPGRGCLGVPVLYGCSGKMC